MRILILCKEQSCMCDLFWPTKALKWNSLLQL